MNGKNVLLISMLLVSPVAFAAETSAPTTTTQTPPSAGTPAPDGQKLPVTETTLSATTTRTVPATDLKGNFITVAYAFAKENKLAASFLVATGAVSALAVRAFFASPISEQNDDEDIN